MRHHWTGPASAAAIAIMAAPAEACLYSPPVDLGDVRRAEMVVVGRIVNYRIVEDRETRRDRRILQANWPHLSRQEQRRRARRTRFLTDYARFDVMVDEVLSGQAERVIGVTWDNSTFNEPEAMPGRRYLVALRRLPGEASAHGPGPAVRASPWPGAVIPVQASCSRAFIFEETSAEARGVREILTRR